MGNKLELDLTEAIGAAANSLERVPLGDDRKLLLAAVAAAAPVIERQVRERIAADIEASIDHVAGDYYGRDFDLIQRATQYAALVARGGAR